MKILVSTSLLAPYRVNWIDELSKYAEVDVFYLMDEDKERNPEWCASRPQNCKYALLNSKKIPLLGLISYELVALLKEKVDEYDVIILDGYGYLTQLINMRYLNKKKIPYFVNVDGIVPTKRKQSITHWFKKGIISKIPYFICGAKASNQSLIDYGAGEERIFNHPFTSLYERDIYSDVATEENKGTLRKKLGMKEKHVVVSVGRFSYLNGYGKGYDVLIRSATQMGKDVGWYIIGGEPTEEFEKMRVDAGLDNVHFIKFLNKEELKEFYRAADVFVLMTVADVWGLVVNEAMACGLPIITTDKCVAGLDLVKDGENGYILPVGDDKGLKEKLEILFANEEKIKDAGKKSLEIIREYTIENMAKTHIEIFKKVLNEK